MDHTRRTRLLNRHPGFIARALRAGALAAAVALLPGCQLIGGMAASAERTGSHEVPAKYRGLEGKSFAVVVAADRMIQADHPDAVVVITREIARRIAENVDASGWVPPDRVLEFQARKPGWTALSAADLAKELGAERLVFVDLSEFALHEPGNPHVWAGVASGVLGVVEADGDVPDEYAFQETIRVGFPDNQGLGPMQVPEETVRLALLKRFVERSTWMFFDHTEPNAIKY